MHVSCVYDCVSCMYVCMYVYVCVCMCACMHAVFRFKKQHTVVLPHSGMRVMQPFFGMRVMHWKTWRKGKVIQHYSEGFRANKMTILFDDGEIELRWISAFVQDFPEGFCEQGIVGVPQFRNGLRKETGRLKYFASLHKYAHAYIYIYIYMFVY